MQAIDQAMTKVYGLIWSDYMTLAMIQMMECHPDFETKIKGDPIALFRVLYISMNEATQAQKPVLTMIYVLIELLNNK